MQSELRGSAQTAPTERERETFSVCIPPPIPRAGLLTGHGCTWQTETELHLVLSVCVCEPAGTGTAATGAISLLPRVPVAIVSRAAVERCASRGPRPDAFGSVT